MRTQEEIQKLKNDWMKDPCWDIEDSDGFEEHVAELTAFRYDQEVRWERESADRQAYTDKEAMAPNAIQEARLAMYAGNWRLAEVWSAIAQAEALEKLAKAVNISNEFCVFISE